MKLLGSITELVAVIFRNAQAFQNTISPNSGVTYTADRTIQTPNEDANSILVSRTSTDTLTNKTISGASNTISNVSLTTGVTGILPTANGGTAQNSTATFPTSGVVVTEAATETLTNKTISGSSNTLTVLAGSQLSGQVPTANGGTGQNSTATFPTSGVVVTEAATETLTNKTLDNTTSLTIKAANLVIEDGTDTTKQAKFVASSISTGTTRSYTLPDTSDTLVTLAATQTLTNKTISGSSNTITNVSLTSGVTGTLPIGNGGTNGTTATAGFDNLSPLTTKGDIVAYSGTHNVRFAAGSNGTVLTADSTQTNGLSWTSPLTNPMTSVGDLIVGGTAGAATRLAVGTANQYLSVNTGGTTEEWRTLTTGTSGSDFNIGFATGTTTLNIPDASASNRGLITTGTQTIAGAKTFSGSTTTVNQLYLTSQSDTTSGTTTVNNVSVTAGLYKFTNASATITVTGFASAPEGAQFVLYNGSVNTLTLKYENGGSLAANRIDTGTGDDIRLGSTGTAYLTYAGGRWCASISQEKGIVNGNNAASGSIGEWIENAKTSNGFAITSGTVFSVDSGNSSFNDGNETGITLTPGDWDIQGTCTPGTSGGMTFTECQVFIGTAKGTGTTGFDAARNNTDYNFSVSGISVTEPAIHTPVYRQNISSTTTYYLKASFTFSGGTNPGVVGSIHARRMR